MSNFVYRVISVESNQRVESSFATQLAFSRQNKPGFLEFLGIINRTALIAAIEKLKQKVGQEVKLLHERRTALISATVNGQIDVRDWQPPETELEDSNPAEVLNG